MLPFQLSCMAKELSDSMIIQDLQANVYIGLFIIWLIIIMIAIGIRWTLGSFRYSLIPIAIGLILSLFSAIKVKNCSKFIIAEGTITSKHIYEGEDEDGDKVTEYYIEIDNSGESLQITEGEYNDWNRGESIYAIGMKAGNPSVFYSAEDYMYSGKKQVAEKVYP